MEFHTSESQDGLRRLTILRSKDVSFLHKSDNFSIVLLLVLGEGECAWVNSCWITDHFRVPLSLSFKASLSAKFLL